MSLGQETRWAYYKLLPGQQSYGRSCKRPTTNDDDLVVIYSLIQCSTVSLCPVHSLLILHRVRKLQMAGGSQQTGSGTLAGRVLLPELPEAAVDVGVFLARIATQTVV